MDILGRGHPDQGIFCPWISEFSLIPMDSLPDLGRKASQGTDPSFILQMYSLEQKERKTKHRKDNNVLSVWLGEGASPCIPQVVKSITHCIFFYFIPSETDPANQGNSKPGRKYIYEGKKQHYIACTHGNSINRGCFVLSFSCIPA